MTASVARTETGMMMAVVSGPRFSWRNGVDMMDQSAKKAVSRYRRRPKCQRMVICIIVQHDED